jgi:hypothetical protein
VSHSACMLITHILTQIRLAGLAAHTRLLLRKACFVFRQYLTVKTGCFAVLQESTTPPPQRAFVSLWKSLLSIMQCLRSLARASAFELVHQQRIGQLLMLQGAPAAESVLSASAPSSTCCDAAMPMSRRWHLPTRPAAPAAAEVPSTSDQGWKHYIEQGIEINPCGSPNHPAVLSGLMQADGPAKSLQEVRKQRTGGAIRHLSVGLRMCCCTRNTLAAWDHASQAV